MDEAGEIASTATLPKTAEAAAVPTLGERVGRFRWVICGLLFFATTVNYVDRQVVSLLGPTLSQTFGWTDLDYSYIVFNFSLAYALGLLVSGGIIDRLGTKTGYAVALIFW